MRIMHSGEAISQTIFPHRDAKKGEWAGKRIFLPAIFGAVWFCVFCLRRANGLLMASREGAKPRRMVSRCNLSFWRLRVFACDHSEESERAADGLTRSREGWSPDAVFLLRSFAWDH